MLKRLRKRCRIGTLIPTLAVCVFVLESASRWVPVEALSFRAWDALIRFHAPCAPFKADAHYENPKSYGDLAALGNLPQHRQYHQEIFTTDSYGFRRNDQRKSSPPYRVILLGDSLSVGSSVNDDATLSARLEDKLGVGVYNGATPENSISAVTQIVQLARRLQISEGIVVYQYLGRSQPPAVNDVQSNQWMNCSSWRSRLASQFRDYIKFSPVRIIAQQAFKQLQNDTLLPNVFRDYVVKLTLSNGDPMLFYPPDVDGYRRPRGFDLTGIKALNRALAKEKLRLVVLLVPDKYAVYETLLKDADDEDRTEPFYLEILEEELARAKIPVVNLTDFLREKARDLYGKRQYLYGLDDTHWNAHGIELGAQELIARGIVHLLPQRSN